MREFTLSAAAGIALAALLSAAPAMAQAYNTDRIGWNRGGEFKTDTVGKEAQCFKGSTGKFDGPQLQGKSANKIPVGEWHALKINMTGDQIQC
jgi:polyisoprenoid-binding protein YceI